MKKSNSDFKTAFISESGAELTNNDYFAYVEHDDYACYVLASGITDFESSQAAKEAVEHLILSFEENPSMSKMTLRQYMKETNERLLNSSNARRLKASVIMVVTDYEQFRYVAAGNVRLRMYRKGRFLLGSSDMSLANDLIQKGESDTPLDRHDERHNLYAYLGKKDDFRPFVSKLQKLDDADIISLYSKGLWEHVDAQEIDEIFAEATDDPHESVDLLEDVLLSRQPPNLKSYTIVAIFINKVYRDPERERKRLLYIKIAVIILVILLLIGIIWYIFQRIRQSKIDDMNQAIGQMQLFTAAENYKRAQENNKYALDLAIDLNEKIVKNALQENLIILDTLVKADEAYAAQDYQGAYHNYLKVMNSSATSYDVKNYVQRRISNIEDRMNVDQFMNLGDYFFQQGKFDEAVAMYNRANEQAVAVHDQAAREKSVAAIEKVYDKQAQLRKDAEQKLDAKKQLAMADAMKKGDDLLAAGDLDGAQNAYLDARNLSDNPADRTLVSAALGEVSKERAKQQQEQAKKDAEKEASDKEKAEAEKAAAEARQKAFEDAAKIEEKGDASFESGDFLSAQMYYMTAIEKFGEIKEDIKVKSVQGKFDLARAKAVESQGTKVEAEDTEQKARNLYAEKNYEEARTAATKAKELYTKLEMKSKAEEMDILIQQIVTDAQIADALK